MFQNYVNEKSRAWKGSLKFKGASITVIVLNTVTVSGSVNTELPIAEIVCYQLHKSLSAQKNKNKKREKAICRGMGNR